jgi:hypothetical protein
MEHRKMWTFGFKMNNITITNRVFLNPYLPDMESMERSGHMKLLFLRNALLSIELVVKWELQQ